MTLSRKEAKNAYKIVREKEYLFLSESAVVDEMDQICLFGRKEPKFQVYPALDKIPKGFVRLEDKNGFAVYQRKIRRGKLETAVTELKITQEYALYEIEIRRKEVAEESKDAYLILDYHGDCAKLLIDKKLEDDHFYQGDYWEIGLRRYGFPKKVQIEITALKETDERFLETLPKMEQGRACLLAGVWIEEEFQTQIEGE